MSLRESVSCAGGFGGKGHWQGQKEERKKETDTFTF